MDSKGKKKALIIAISKYDQFDNLDFCNNDGKEMEITLCDLGYEMKKEWVLIGDVNFQQMDNAIKDFFRGDHVSADDTLLFYYSGHGTPHGRHDYYFVSSRTKTNSPDVDGFAYDNLSRFVHNSISSRIVTILDCCYSGAMGISKGSENSRAVIGKWVMASEFEEGEGRYLLASSLGTQESFGLQNKQRSIFTHHLLEGLRGNSPDAIDELGRITPETLAKSVYNNMKNLSVDQKPIRKTEGSGDTILAQLEIKEIDSSQFLDTEKIQTKIEINLLGLLEDSEFYARSFDTIKKKPSSENKDDVHKLLQSVGATKVKIPKKNGVLWALLDTY